jgi:phosphatidate cytidylyltransferase
MLKKRILTALVLLPIFIALVLYLPPLWFGLVTCVFVLLGAYEWSGFLGIQSKFLRLTFPVFIYPFFTISLYIPIPLTMMVTLLFWLVALVLVIRYPAGAKRWGKSIIWRGLMGLFVLIPAWRAINFLRANDGPYVLLFLFVLIWIADSGAYFAGKLFGKHKLLPEVSPGKTWEGLAGALLLSGVFSLSLTKLIPSETSWLNILLLGLVTVLFSVLGDLFESMLKRNVNLKDSGQLFPGHGGLLDRIDSLTAAAPVFVFLGILLKILH